MRPLPGVNLNRPWRTRESVATIFPRWRILSPHVPLRASLLARRPAPPDFYDQPPRRKCSDTNYFRHFFFPIPAVAAVALPSHPRAFMLRSNIRLDYSSPLSENLNEKDRH